MRRVPGVPFGRAVILAVGSELLTPLRIDTNSLTITSALNATGIDVIWKAVVGDAPEVLSRLLARAREDAELVVLSGGLGPTDDDRTRDVVSAVLGLPLREDAAIVEAIASRFAARGWPMPANNRRQANVPEGAVVLPNSRGTAPGLWIEQAGRALLLLPGPPRELAPLLEDALQAYVRPRTGGRRIVRRIVRMTGRGESLIDELLQPYYREWAARTVPVSATILAAMGQLELHLSATHADAAQAESAVAVAAEEACARVGRDAFTDRGEHLEEVVGHLLASRGWRVAVAESCTGGLLAGRLTAAPGASRYFDQGVVTYSNAAKVEWLGVPEALMAEHGAVSDAVARAMASGIRERAGADVGVGVTGIAGPDGGTAEKPVGTVVIAVALRESITSRTLHLLGDREQIRSQSAQAALDLVRRVLTP
ncbi:MAG: competence/damage-inducible protein A [Vicinamibacterales bacterium]|nr:competence/damage-inducible protein A [Vicinamibacterales bacterium]